MPDTIHIGLDNLASMTNQGYQYLLITSANNIDKLSQCKGNPTDPGGTPSYDIDICIGF